MSHRFIRVTIQDEEIEDFNKEFVNYIKRLEDEDPGMVYYNIQEDGTLFEMVDIPKEISSLIPGCTTFTIMMINSNRPTDAESIENSNILKNSRQVKTPVGYMYQLTEDEVRSSSHSTNQGYWFLLFLELLSRLTKNAKFLELRAKAKKSL